MSSGLSGTVTRNGRMFRIGAWSLIEGNPFDRDEWRGRFWCLDPGFAARPMTNVQLEISLHGEKRTLTVTVTATYRSRQVWEFRVRRALKKPASYQPQAPSPG
jgi:hypothetical protein